MLTEKHVNEKAENIGSRGCALLLGGFDGLHKGHETLLSAAKKTGLPIAAITIEGGKGAPLYVGKERDEIFFRHGVDFVYPLEFSAIRNISAEAFAAAVKEKISPACCFCGEDFRFGAGGKADGADFGRYTGVPVHVLPLLKDEKTGEKIGAEKIKALLGEGKAEEANALLCDDFFLSGAVVKDRGIGREIGFPTANIFYPQGKFRLKNAVYETRAAIDGKEYKGITNFGSRPTFGNDTVVTETYFLGYSGNLYGKTLSIRFVRFLRDIKKFADAKALQSQLEYDKRRVQSGD